jgi:hypothetical protein
MELCNAANVGTSALVEGVAGRGSQDQWIAGVGLTYLSW